MYRKIVSDSFLYAIAPQLPKLAGLFLLPVLTHHLTASDYAIYGIVMAYVGGMQGLRDLGMTQVMVNQFYKSDAEKVDWRAGWRRISGLLHGWGVLYTLILGIVVYASLHSKIGAQTWAVLGMVLIPALFFDITVACGFRYFQIRQKPLPVAVNATIAGILSIVVNYISVVWYHQHYLGFFWAQFASTLFSFCFFAYFIYIDANLLPVFRLKLREFKPQLRVALPTIPHNYSSYLLNASDRVILDVMKVRLGSVGQYNFAYTFGNYADMVGGALGLAVSPFFLRLYAERNAVAERKVRFLTFLLQAIFLLGSAVVALWCKEILNLLASNPELAAAYPLAALIVLSYSYRPMYWGAVNRLGFEEQTSHLWKISFVGGVINVVLNVVLIPFLGIYATVLSTFIGLMYIGFAGFFLKVYRRIVSLDYYPVRWLIIIVLTSAAVYLLQDATAGVKALVTAGALLVTAFFGLHFKTSIRELNQA